MQTFLPYKDFKDSFYSLDKRRAFKQVVEAKQLLNIVMDRTTTKGWRNHPAALMWMGYGSALQMYYNTFYTLCRDVHGVKFVKMSMEDIKHDVHDVVMPDWLGDYSFHHSHRCNLWRKALSDKAKKYMPLYNLLKDNPDFNQCDPNMDYIWPSNYAKLL